MNWAIDDLTALLEAALIPVLFTPSSLDHDLTMAQGGRNTAMGVELMRLTGVA